MNHSRSSFFREIVSCDPLAMNHVHEFSVKSLPHQNESAPQCTTNHSYPAVIFATAGYNGNFFHDLSNIMLPLFLTTRWYNGEVQFFMTNTRPFVLKKYRLILKNLTRYKIIDIDDKGGHGNIHCYKSMTVGLDAHREFSIDPLIPPLGYTFPNFTEFMQKSYSLERHALTKHKRSTPKKPRLLLISRRGTRKLLNVDEIATMASALGFETIVMEGGEELDKIAPIMNSCNVLVGVHGAGLTHVVFLPQKVVLVQIIPWGRMEGLSWCDNGFLALNSKFKYLEYQAKLEESTILNKYPRDNPYIQDLFSVHVKGWFLLKDVYMSQDVIVDLQRFRGTLVEALEHVKKYK